MRVRHIREDSVAAWQRDLLDRLERDVQLNTKTLGLPGRADHLRQIIMGAPDAEAGKELYRRTSMAMLFGKWKPAKDASRAHDSGRYQHSSVLRLCTCGHPLGMHTAEGDRESRPCIVADFTDEECACEKFRPTRKFMTAPEAVRAYGAGVARMMLGVNEARAGGVRVLIERLEEATYARDADFRGQAVTFAKRLEAFFRSADRTGTAGDPVQVQEYGESLAVESESVMPGVKHLLVRLVEEGRKKNARAAVAPLWNGKFQMWVALLPSGFSYPEDAKRIADAIGENRETFVHEFVHTQDFLRGAPSGRAKKMKDGGRDLVQYFNSPTEWNAFFQQGAAAVERNLEDLRRNFPEKYDEWKGKGAFASAQDLIQSAYLYWREDFVERMDAQTRRRFEKRVAAFWEGLHAQGLVGKP